MPGVPSGRGCEACRKQKKKCESGQTPCSRCARLDIPCLGKGQQRFKFKNESQALVFVHEGRPKRSRATKPGEVLAAQTPRSLSNGTTLLMSALVGRIGGFVDIRYQLPWNFGGYLHSIPRRLGTSAALDAATDALVTGHKHFCAGRFDPSGEGLKKHSRALRILRRDLDDEVKARSSETLCAIMVLIITQVFVDPSEGHAVTHTEGAARLLKARGLNGPVDEFETILILTLRGSVVVEALLNDKIDFTKHEWDTLVEQRLNVDNEDGKLIRCLARVPYLTKRIKVARRSRYSPISRLADLELEVAILRMDCKAIIAGLRDQLDNFDVAKMPFEIRYHLHAHRLRMLGLALATGIIINCLLDALDGGDLNHHEESFQWSSEIVQLAEASIPYRPLGSMLFLMNLGLAWIAAPDEVSKALIKALLIDYEKECLGPTSTDWDTLLENRRRRFTLEDG